jgi:UDP:flavonoid glycosyltransferase YjiC (YdhE family)
MGAAMARILYCWELGEDLGHISNFLPVALALRARGHTVIAALHELGRAEAVFGPHGIPLLQAPVWLQPPAEAPHPPQSFAEMLIHFGFADPPGLTAMLRGWRNLIALADPDLMIADHAPTALLAARSRGVPSATYGAGFFLPPFTTPLPKLRPWLTIPAKRLLGSEQAVLAGANAALAAFGAAPLATLADLYRGAEHFLMTYPELDQFPMRAGGQYRGVILSTASGAVPDWPAGAGPKVFAYLKPQFADLEKVLTLLTALDCRVILYCGGLPARARADLSNSRIRISPRPYDITRAAAECDLALCHAGQGTVAAILLAGKPLLLLPFQLEQFLLSQRVAQLGAGVFIDPDAREKDHAGALRALLSEPRFAENARAFARKYASAMQPQIIAAIAERCEGMLRADAGRDRRVHIALD